MNIHLRAAIVGLATGVTAGILWMAGWLFLPLAVDMLSNDGGLGAASVGSDSTLMVTVAGVVLGYVFALKRARRVSQTSRQGAALD